MLMRDAWNLIAAQGDSVLFEEMRITATQMDNGVPELAAYNEFAERCGVKEIRKFSSMVIQGLEKGGSELTGFLKDMSDEMWAEKKNIAKRKGEAANAKLLIPTVIIFIGILFMIMAPLITGL
jgi:tight adherence protein C